MFTLHVDSLWGDIDQAAIEVGHDNYPLIDLDQDKVWNEIEKYDIVLDLKHAKYSTPIKGTYESQFWEITHPFLLRMTNITICDTNCIGRDNQH